MSERCTIVVYVRQRFAGYSPPQQQCQPAHRGGGGGGMCSTEGGQPTSAVCAPSTSVRAESTAVSGVARPMVRFSQPVLSTINELCSQAPSACNYQQHAAAAVPQPTKTTDVKARRQLRERGNTSADISLHFGPPTSPEKQQQPTQSTSREAATASRRRVTVVGAPPSAAKQRPIRTSMAYERYPAAATASATTIKLVKQTLTSASPHSAMTPVG